MEQKIYNSAELNEMIGYKDPNGRNSAKEDILRRCKNAGLKVQSIDTPRGLPNKYIIVEDNFHLNGEEWIDCVFNKDWEVSNLGRIRRKTTKKLMGNQDPNSNYIRITMIDENTKKQTNQMVHRLVYFSFHPEHLNLKDTMQIDHINGIRTDNRLENLQPLSIIKNIQKRDECQETIRSLTTELIIKYGYEEVEKKLKNLLTNGL